MMIRANQLDFSGDEMEEGMSYYDEESLSLCGMEDFLRVVAAYREFAGKPDLSSLLSHNASRRTVGAVVETKSPTFQPSILVFL